MFKIQDNKILLTRGDKCTIAVTIDGYTFKQGDYIKFKVYKKNKLNQKPLLTKKIEVKTETDEIEIKLLSSETKIEQPQNDTTTYWYEIELNDEQTILGYDDNGAKILLLYPEGADGDEQ